MACKQPSSDEFGGQVEGWVRGYDEGFGRKVNRHEVLLDDFDPRLVGERRSQTGGEPRVRLDRNYPTLTAKRGTGYHAPPGTQVDAG